METRRSAGLTSRSADRSKAGTVLQIKMDAADTCAAQAADRIRLAVIGDPEIAEAIPEKRVVARAVFAVDRVIGQNRGQPFFSSLPDRPDPPCGSAVRSPTA